MNLALRKQLFNNKNLQCHYVNKITLFYSLTMRTKFRRLTQPGYSRYNWDDLGDTQNGFKVKS